MLNSSTKTNKCENCLKAFTRLCDLKRHELVHTEAQRPFECEFCHKAFSTSYYLQRHTVIHTGEMSFECDVCFKKFKHSSDLQRHAIIHTGETPFECEICGREFNDKSNLRAHESTHQREIMQCSICGIFIRSKTTLKSHIQQQHTLDGEHLEYEMRRSTRNVLRNGHGAGDTPQTTIMSSDQSAERYEPNLLYESAERWNCRMDTSNRMMRSEGKNGTVQFSTIVKKRIPTIYTRKSDLQCGTCHKMRPCEWKRAERPFKCGTCGQTFKQKTHLRSHELTHQDNLFRCSICLIFVKHKAGLRQHLRKQHYFMGEQLNDIVKNIYESSRTRETKTHEMTDVNSNTPLLDERFLGTNLEYLEVGQEWEASDQFVDVSNPMIANTKIIEVHDQVHDNRRNSNDPEEVPQKRHHSMLNEGNLELDNQFVCEAIVPEFEKLDYSKYPELDPEVWYAGIIREQLETSRMAL